MLVIGLWIRCMCVKVIVSGEIECFYGKLITTPMTRKNWMCCHFLLNVTRLAHTNRLLHFANVANRTHLLVTLFVYEYMKNILFTHRDKFKHVMSMKKIRNMLGFEKYEGEHLFCHTFAFELSFHAKWQII